MSEELIRESERRKMAQELLDLLGTAHRRLQPGMFQAAIILDPSIMGSSDD